VAALEGRGQKKGGCGKFLQHPIDNGKQRGECRFIQSGGVGS